MDSDTETAASASVAGDEEDATAAIVCVHPPGTEFDVVLKDKGKGSSTDLLKALGYLTGQTMTESKKIVDAPHWSSMKVIKEYVLEEEAIEAKMAIEAVGAVIENVVIDWTREDRVTPF